MEDFALLLGKGGDRDSVTVRKKVYYANPCQVRKLCHPVINPRSNYVDLTFRHFTLVLMKTPDCIDEMLDHKCHLSQG